MINKQIKIYVVIKQECHAITIVRVNNNLKAMVLSIVLRCRFLIPVNSLLHRIHGTARRHMNIGISRCPKFKEG